MAKKAFCVGINDYPYEDNDLKGCVNDARDWATLLTRRFDFPKSDVTMLTDAQATKKNIVAGLKSLMAGSTAGDILVFTNSSHGSYISDKDGDETYDEVICPHDIDSNVLVDDELRVLFDGLKRGVRFTMISDSCHSGSLSRAMLTGLLPGMTFKDDRRVRFLNPALFRRTRIFANALRVHPRRMKVRPQSSMKEVLVTGCTDIEVSYDAKIGGTYHGAMTYHAIKAIEAAKYKITYAQLGQRLNRALPAADYFQHPQVEGRRENRARQVFT
jgi:hypothetical protein